MLCTMNIHSKKYYFALPVNINSKASINYSREKYSREKSSVCTVRGKHCGLPAFEFPGSMQTSQKGNWIFTHVGLSAHAHNNYCARG